MISATAIAASFERNVSIVKMQTDSMTQTDSLVQLPFRANCMNWVIGHLVTNRLNVIKLLEGLPTFDPAPLVRYRRESEPVTGEADGVLQLNELIRYLEQAQAQIANLLASADPELFMHQIAFFGNRSMTIGEWLLFFYFHNSYHTGQTEIYRQAAGKNDKII